MVSIKKNHSFLIVLLIVMHTFSNVALSQTKLPEFFLSNSTKEQPLNNEEIPSIKIQRALTQDILTLQGQINLLEVLIKRQAEISKLAKSYSDMGIPFKQPPPDLSACNKLPLNTLCVFSYPDLEKHNDIIIKVEKSLKGKNETAIQQILESFEGLSLTAENEVLLNELVLPNGDINMVADIENEPVIEEHYFWEDIRCLNNKCTALIFSDEEQGDRVRVSPGYKVDENISIVQITPTKVTAKIGDVMSTIQPKALEGKTQSKNPPIKSAEQEEKMQVSIAPPLTAPSFNTQPPELLLGPTGLF